MYENHHSNDGRLRKLGERHTIQERDAETTNIIFASKLETLERHYRLLFNRIDERTRNMIQINDVALDKKIHETHGDLEEITTVSEKRTEGDFPYKLPAYASATQYLRLFRERESVDVARHMREGVGKSEKKREE